MTKRHLIAIDVDGTLLDKEAHLSTLTSSVLKERIAKGDVIVLASGRPWRSLRPYYMALGLTGPVICYNGALVFDPAKESFKPLKKLFKKEDIQSISSQMSPQILSLMCESETTIYANKEDEYLSHYFPYAGMKKEIGAFPDAIKEDTYTAIFSCLPENDETLRNAIESHAPLKFRHWRGVPYSEAYYSGVDKGSALLYVMAELGFKQEDVIAFGDSDNDYEMLALAGHPFAMAESKSPLLLANFPHTKKGNDHDGVALALKELLD
jgi:5-amino-6-(5-phospho-D-ribitylamino)uracil phosphatase